MAEFNRNQNGVFGEVKFEGNNNVTENTSYFEGTIPGANLTNEQNNGKQSEQAGKIFVSFSCQSSFFVPSSSNNASNSSRLIFSFSRSRSADL